MEITNIVEELVEKRMNDRIQQIIEGDRSSQWDKGELQNALREKVKQVLKEEIEKRDAEIRKALNDKITAGIEGQKVKVSVNMWD